MARWASRGGSAEGMEANIVRQYERSDGFRRLVSIRSFEERSKEDAWFCMQQTTVRCEALFRS